MEVSDETLVSQALRLDDSDAFEALVRRHQPRVLLLHRRLAGDPAIAEDLCQETFLRAWRKLGTYQASGRFGAWLGKLAYNVFLQHVRRAGRAPAPGHVLELDAACELPANGAALSSDGAGDEVPDLPKLLGILSQEEQVLMVLSYAHGLSNNEISEVLGVPPGTVKSQIHRAKDKIRKRFRIGVPA